MFPVDVTESAVTAFREADPDDWVMFPATVNPVRFPTLVIAVWAAVANVPVILPVDVTESAVTAFRVAVPEDWVMFPDTLSVLEEAVPLTLAFPDTSKL